MTEDTQPIVVSIRVELRDQLKERQHTILDRSIPPRTSNAPYQTFLTTNKHIRPQGVENRASRPLSRT
jgi:hypothetical protein